MAERTGVAVARNSGANIRMTDHRTEANMPEARLLVVDDNEDNRYTLVMRLQIEGYQDIATAEMVSRRWTSCESRTSTSCCST